MNAVHGDRCSVEVWVWWREHASGAHVERVNFERGMCMYDGLKK